MYAWSVFASPMEAHLGKIAGISLSPGALAIVFTVANSLGPITMISGGRINDKLGPRWVVFIGGLMFGGGMLLSGFTTSVGMLIFTYGILCGLGMGMVYGCTIGNSVKLFPDKRGLVGGIATASYGISSVIIPPVANTLIQSAGVTASFKIFGITFLIVICAGAFFIDKCPADFIPKGWIPSTNPNSSTSAAENKDWKGMLSTPDFYIMILMLTCGAFCGLMCISQASAIARNIIGMSITAAAAMVSVLALFNALGRIFAGVVSDKIGRVYTLAAAFVLSIAGLVLIYLSSQGEIVKFTLGISLIGLCFGALMGVFPGFTADQFGAGNNSVNYGIMFIGFAIAGFFGPTIMNLTYKADGSYGRAFITAGCLAAVGLALAFIFKAFIKNRIKLPLSSDENR